MNAVPICVKDSHYETAAESRLAAAQRWTETRVLYEPILCQVCDRGWRLLARAR